MPCGVGLLLPGPGLPRDPQPRQGWQTPPDRRHRSAADDSGERHAPANNRQYDPRDPGPHRPDHRNGLRHVHQLGLLGPGPRRRIHQQDPRGPQSCSQQDTGPGDLRPAPGARPGAQQLGRKQRQDRGGHGGPPAPGVGAACRTGGGTGRGGIQLGYAEQGPIGTTGQDLRPA